MSPNGVSVVQKCVCNLGSAPDGGPTRGAYSAPSDPPAGLKGPISEGREGRREKKRGWELILPNKNCPCATGCFQPSNNVHLCKKTVQFIYSVRVTSWL